MEKIRYKRQQRSQSRPPSEVVIREDRAPPPPHHHLFLSTPEKVSITFDHEYLAPRHKVTCTTTTYQKHILETPQQHQAIFSNDDNLEERWLEKEKENRTRTKSLICSYILINFYHDFIKKTDNISLNVLPPKC